MSAAEGGPVNGRAARWHGPWWRALAGLLCLPVLAHATGAPATDAPSAGRWDFTVSLDGKPIGTHRFVVTGGSGARSVESRAQFVVRWLGVPVYRYRHEAHERWQGDCLRELRAETETNGERQAVNQRLDDGCRMGFAYWNPRLVSQSTLVNPQTGEATPVRVERLPDASIERLGQPVPARGWQLRTSDQRIDVWYAADSGRWIALDAELEGGRRLSYRLSSSPTPP